MISNKGPGNYLIRAEVKEIRFGLYSEDEIKSTSVCQVVSSVSSDKKTLASVRGGLYDPRMGPREQQSPPCETCGLVYMYCPGHSGHIDLDVPVYHPLHFKNLYQLLQSKCVHCHK
jgi:DNA-directed RNA polymerase I subunit RPA1